MRTQIAQVLTSKRSEEVIGQRKLPTLTLQVIGTLSAVIFTSNLCLEIATLFALDKAHQILVVCTLICLASWALLEVFLLQRHTTTHRLLWLKLLAGMQLLLEMARLTFIIWGPRYGIDSNFGLFRMETGPLYLLVPAYLFIFFGISKSLMFIHAQELSYVWNQLTQAAVSQSRAQERQQLIRDMHDGFGSQIATLRIMADQGRLDPSQLPTYLAEISADLHLIVDTFKQTEDVTLSTALADLRFRLRKRIGNGEIKVHWMMRINPEPILSAHDILNILRIIQEGVSNSLRHASASNIWIEIEVDPAANNLKISVRDDGIGIPNSLQPGRGLSNMEARARELGGTLQLNRQNRGSEVALAITIKAATL